MKVFFHPSEAKGKIKNAVVTTGSFDGVHVGHKVIINRLNQIAREMKGESVLITFHPHPRKVLYPDQKDLKLINTQEEKIDLLRKAGLDNLIIVPFTVDFSRTTSHEFIASILIGTLDANVIVIGHNHHFGHNREGDYSYLHLLSKQLGFAVEEIPLQDIENETVSSTKIRKALFEGNMQRANAYLDHQYIVHGKLTLGEVALSDSSIKTFTTTIPEEEKLIPPPGIYATNLLVNNDFFKSMTLISRINDTEIVQTHLIYDKHTPDMETGTLYFYKKVSDMDVIGKREKSINCLNAVKEMVEDLIY
jgi:riboflavin kinase / FMN adenylyltransferase